MKHSDEGNAINQRTEIFSHFCKEEHRLPRAYGRKAHKDWKAGDKWGSQISIAKEVGGTNSGDRNREAKWQDQKRHCWT